MEFGPIHRIGFLLRTGRGSPRFARIDRSEDPELTSASHPHQPSVQRKIQDADEYACNRQNGCGDIRVNQLTAYPDYGEVPGNRGWILLRRPVSDIVEFMFVSFCDSMEALAKYTGGDPERPKYYPEDRAALLELPEGVEHYQVVDLQARW